MKILSERIGPNGKAEYLVQWVEYPEGDSWESLENLRNVADTIEQFKLTQQRKFDLKKVEFEKRKEKKLLEEKLREVRVKGSFEQKDTLESVIGLRRNLMNGEIECLCLW